MDQMSKKLASNDKILENISTRIDNVASTIKNQHSFNKIIESQIAQLAATVPPSDKGNILRQPEDLETTNLIDIHNAAFYYTQPSEGRWIDYTLPNKKSDLGRPIIPISIERHIFQKAICDFRASVNIMPKVINDKILGDPLLYTNICLQLVDQSLCYPKGILEDAIIRVGQSYVPIGFVVLEIGDERAPIILGRPFRSTTKAIIYVDTANLFHHQGQEGEVLIQRLHTIFSCSSLPEETIEVTKKKKNRRRRKNKISQSPKEIVNIINTIRSEYDHLLTPPFLEKKDDPSVPTIEYTIG
jgi:hypothetical protein